MDISVKSWHYKLVDTGLFKNHPVPNNLCTYFWYVVLAAIWRVSGYVIVASFATVLGVMLLGIAISPLLALVDTYIFSFIPTAWYDDKAVFSTWAFVGTVVYSLIGLYWVFHRLVKAMRDRRDRKRGTPPAPPGIVAQRYADFRSKTCTLLNFTDKPAEEEY